MAQEERRQSLEVTKLNAAQKHKEREALIANIVNPSIETVETIPDVFAIAIHISEDQPQATVKMVNFDQKNKMTLQVLLIMLPMSIYLSIKMISSCGSVSLKARCSSLASRSSGRKDRFVPRWTVNTLSGCHCTNMVLSIWRQSFPQVVHNSIANLDINANTFARGVCFFKRLALGLSNSRPSER